MCQVDVDDEYPVTSMPGDLVLLPHGHRSVLRDDPSTPPLALEQMLARSVQDSDGMVHRGGGGEATTLVVGKVDLDAPHRHPLYQSLPHMIVVRSAEGVESPWLAATIELLTCEATAGQPGAALVLGHLSGIVFVQAVRAWLAHSSSSSASWAHALSDPHVGRALVAVHERTAAGWTVATLAREAGLSRSGFAQRFTRLVGEPPLTYVARWRMVEAARFLRGGLGSSEVADQVGYASESAFNVQFKRWIGTTPGAYRKEARTKLFDAGQ